MLFTKNRHLARRCFFARGGRRGCAPGAPARPAAVPAYAVAACLSPAALSHKPSPVAPPLFTPRPDPRLRLRALCRPCGRPKPPFSGALAAAATVPALFLNSRFFSVRGNYFGIIIEFILTVVCVQTVYLLLYIIKLSVAEAHDIRRLQQRGNKSFVAGKVHLRFRCIAIAG